MSKNKNTPLALEILQEQRKRTRFWFTAFIVAFTVVVIDRLKGGVENE